MINIKGIDKYKVLQALYNNSRPLGMGFIQYVEGDMEDKIAKKIVKDTLRFDYLFGRVMKVDLSGDEFDHGLYDRDNGEGAAQKAIGGINETTN